MNHKNQRILKLIKAGRTNEQIIRTIGSLSTKELNDRINKLREESNA